MDRSTLAAKLASGQSIEAIAREHGRDPSTIAYWVNKYGLVSLYAQKHALAAGYRASSSRSWSRPGSRCSASRRSSARRDDGAVLAQSTGS